MKIIVGLGNPGEEYARHRHNVGRRFAEFLISNLQSANKFQILTTDCFMNESGNFVRQQLSNLSNILTGLWIVHDDLDMPLGKFKIQFGVGPRVHRGLNSIEETLGTKDFWRVRIGIDNRGSGHRTPGKDYVLEDFTGDELKVLEDLFLKIWEELSLKLKIKS